MELGEIANSEAQRYGKPLDGVRVLAIEQMQALPYATQMLRRFGAEVVKIEPPGKGESARQALPMIRDPEGDAVGNTYLRNNLGKRTIGVDLKHPAGRDLVLRLAPHFDVVGQNFKSGTIQRLGLGYDDVATRPPVGRLRVGVGVRLDPPVGVRRLAGLRPGGRGHVGPLHVPGSRRRRPRSSRRWARWATPAPRSSRSSASWPRSATATAPARASTSTSRCSTRWWRWPTPSVNYWSMGLFGGATAPLINHSFHASDGYFIIQCARRHQFEALARTIGHEEWLDDPRIPDAPSWFDAPRRHHPSRHRDLGGDRSRASRRVVSSPRREWRSDR